MDAITVLLQIAFYLLLASTAWRYFRRRDQLDLDLVAIFATNAAVFGSALLGGVNPALGALVTPWAVVVFLAQPWLVVRLIDHVRAIPRPILILVFVGFVSAAIPALLLGPRQPIVLTWIVSYFAVVEIGAAGRMYRDSRRRFGVPRFRLRLAAASTGLFALSILLSGSRAASGANLSPLANELLALSRLGALLAGSGYLAAFSPPRWLRAVAQRSIAFDVARGLVAGGTATDPARPWHELAGAAREILGAEHVLIRDVRGSGLLAEVGQPSSASAVAGASPTSRVDVAISVDHAPIASLTATIEGRPLFVEDDIWLLEVLGGLTARAVERDDALVRLGEANRALAESEVLRASEARFRAILDADPNAMFALAGDGRIAWATRMAGELFGSDPSGLIGRAFAELVAVQEAELHEELQGEQRVWRVETEAVRVDGSTFPAEVAITDVQLEGGPYRIVVVADATWRREASELRDRFLGVLSHELRTPVTSIFAGSQLLVTRGDRLAPDVKDEVLSGLAAEADRLSRMVENLLVLAQVERGGELFEPRPLLISRTLPELIERERRLWPGITIDVKLERSLPMVSADEENVAHVLRNLLSNAAKYGGPEGRIAVTVSTASEGVVVRVADEGPGIVDGDAERLFDLYYRSPSLAGTASGAGIGLFVCREIVRHMGGRIWATGRPGGGAEFAFSIPLFIEEPLPEAVGPGVVPAWAPVAAPIPGGPAHSEEAVSSVG